MRAERFKVVSVLDPALDLSAPERMEYANSRDWALVEGRFVPGLKPVIYHVREVPHGLWEEYVDATDIEVEKAKRAFMVGIEQVENMPGPNGAPATWSPKTRHRLDINIMNEDELRLFRPQPRAEIGMVIYQHSFLPLAIGLRLPVLSSWLAPLAGLDAHRAQRMPITASVTNNGAHSEERMPSADAISPT